MLAEKIAQKMDNLQSKSEMISSLQESLYISIFCQDAFLKTDFEEAFILLGIMISEIVEELKELTGFAFENLRQEIVTEPLNFASEANLSSGGYSRKKDGKDNNG